MAKPTIVCVPGAWHPPEIYADTIANLNKHGYPTLGLPLPSVGAVPPHNSFDEDVKAIRACLTRLVVDEEKEAILVTHSYTGLLGTEAPVGLGKKEREEKGLKGGVTRLVFIMSFAMPEGFSCTGGGAQYPGWMKIDIEKGVATLEPGEAKEILYNDMSPEQGDEWFAKLSHQSLGVYNSTTTYAAWRYIPSTFVIGMEDQTNFSLEFVNFMIKAAREQQPTAFDVVERCEGGGHCLMISHPDWLAGVLRRAAGEVC